MESGSNDISGDQVQPVKIVDLFAGPGGLDVAAEKLGIPTVGIEWDASACETRCAAGLETVADDVRLHGPFEYPEANVLAGGPPCQTFTVAGTGAGRRALDDVRSFVKRMVAREDSAEIKRDLANLSDVRTGLVLEPLRWALEAIDGEAPYQAIVLEQVPAVLPVWEAYAEALRSEGYAVDCDQLRTEEYGVPQTRKRAVLIARLGAESVRLPHPTHRTYRKGVPRYAGDPNLRPWRTMAEVVDDRGCSFSVISNYGTGGDPKARGRRTHNEPSATVTGKIFRNRVVSDAGDELLRFNFSEAGRLQTFPPDYPWRGKDVGQQIGNAVPPRLAMHVLSAAFGWGPPTDDMLNRLETETWETAAASAQSIREDRIVKDVECV